MQALRLTIREAAESLQRQYGGKILPDWKLRRLVDSMESAGSLDVQRVGNYRTVSSDDIGTIFAELQRMGWLDNQGAVAC